MVLTIYKTDGSPPARSVLMTVELLKLKPNFVEVSIPNKDHVTPEYLKKNPTHTVPLLEDGDLIVADSHVIITYLTSKYGGDLQESLYPNDLSVRAKIDHRLYLDASVIFPRLLVIVRSILHEKAVGPNEKQLGAALEAYGFLEKYLEQTKYLAGDHVTLADVSAVATVSSMNIVVPVDANKFPRIVEWWNKLKTETWYQKANAPGLAIFDKYIRGAMKQNTQSS